MAWMQTTCHWQIVFPEVYTLLHKQARKLSCSISLGIYILIFINCLDLLLSHYSLILYFLIINELDHNFICVLTSCFPFLVNACLLIFVILLLLWLLSICCLCEYYQYVGFLYIVWMIIFLFLCFIVNIF